MRYYLAMAVGFVVGALLAGVLLGEPQVCERTDLRLPRPAFHGWHK